MNRRRYEGYVAFTDAVADEPVDGHSAAVLGDLAEGLLLARDGDEARAARDRVPGELAQLVERGDVQPATAHRLWFRMRACGPSMTWPDSWQWAVPARTGRAIQGR